MIYPSKETEGAWNSHFSALTLQGVVQEAAENVPDVGDVLLKIAGKNLDVVQVHEEKVI